MKVTDPDPFVIKHLQSFDEEVAVEDDEVKKYLLKTVYDEEFTDRLSNENYVTLRDSVIQKSKNTIYFPELISRLSELNIRFGLK